MSYFGKDKTMRPHVNMSTSCRHVKISPCLWLQLVTQVPVEIWLRVKLKLKIDRSVKTLWQEYGVVAGWSHDFDLYDKNVAHCFNELIAIIWGVLCRISTSNRVLRISTCTKSDSRITPIAVIFIVANQTDSCFGVTPCRTKGIETFHVAIELQRSLWTNQCLPRVTTQKRGVVLPVCDQWIHRVSLLVDGNKINLLTDLHTKTDSGEGRFPVCR